MPEPWDLTRQPPDLAVLVALEEEFLELQSVIGVNAYTRWNDVHAGYDYFWIDPRSGHRCIATFAGRMGPDEAVRTTGRLLEFKPAAIVNVGIAGSIHEDVRIGDVIVPDMIAAYDKTAKAVDGESTWRWERRGDNFRVPHSFIEKVQHLVSAHSAQHRGWQEAGEREFAAIHDADPTAFAPVLALDKKVLRERPKRHIVFLGSGNFVGASPQFSAWLRTGNADIKAVEMEAAGMLLAAEKRATPTPALVLRGISDHQDLPKAQSDAVAEGALRGLAMRNALRLLRILMELDVFPRHVTPSVVTPAKPEVLYEGPHESPVAALGDFTGRIAPLAELEQLLDQNVTVCVVATGIGGIGKTTLVQQFLAIRGLERFPDGSAWLDARNLIGDLARVSRRFGWPEAREPGPDDAITFLRKTLNGLRFLFVVDNVDPDTTLTNIPILGGGCRTLVTSRQTTLVLALPGARALLLKLWSAEESLAFLRHLCPRMLNAGDDEVGELASFVGRLPLGVRLVASFLANRPSLSPAAALAELKHQQLGALEQFRGTHPGVVETFRAAWGALPSAGRAVLKALAVCATPTNTHIVAAVAQIGDPSGTLDMLATRSLVQFADGSATPWSLHDVVRMFVDAKSGSETFIKAHLQWVRSHFIENEDPLKHEGFNSGVAEAACAFTRALTRRDFAVAFEIYVSLSGHFHRVGRLAEAVDLSELLMSIAPVESAITSVCLNTLGLCYREMGKVRQAIDCHQQSFNIDTRLGHQEGQANALGNLGLCHEILNEIDNAISYHKRALAIDTRLRRLGEQATDLGNLGTCHQQRKSLGRAIKYHEKALEIDERLAHLDGQANHLGNLGCCYQANGELVTAIGYYERSLAISIKIGRMDGQSYSYANLGSCYLEQGDFVKAMNYLERALRISEQQGRLHGQAAALHHIGCCHAKMRDVGKARECQNRSLDFYREIGMPDSHPEVRGVLKELRSLG